MRSISGKVIDVERPSWGSAPKHLCTPGFLNKLDKRRAKARVAKKSRKANR
jgi:hypothetical protein